MTTPKTSAEKVAVCTKVAASATLEVTAAKAALAAATGLAEKNYAFRRIARATETLRQANAAIAAG